MATNGQEKPQSPTTTFSKLKEPNVLLASSNPQKLIRNVDHLLPAASIQLLREEVDRQAIALVRLGEDHLTFSQSLAAKHWRQKISRLYYAALNLKRGLNLRHSGEFSTDVSDHKNISRLPDDFPNRETFATKLLNLRDDRNLADYSHLAEVSELVLQLDDAEATVADFRDNVIAYLRDLGVLL